MEVMEQLLEKQAELFGAALKIHSEIASKFESTSYRCEAPAGMQDQTSVTTVLDDLRQKHDLLVLSIAESAQKIKSFDNAQPQEVAKIKAAVFDSSGTLVLDARTFEVFRARLEDCVRDFTGPNGETLFTIDITMTLCANECETRAS